MTLTKKEKEGFDNVMENIFKPLVEERGEEIQMILDNDPELKASVEKEVDRILKARERNSQNKSKK